MKHCFGPIGGPMAIHPSWPPQDVRGLFSFRLGGVSETPYDSLNVGLHVPDHPEHVMENRRRVAEMLGTPVAHWIVGEQVHGTQVMVVTKGDCGRGATPEVASVAGVDAMVTADPGVALVVMAADCVPILFYDDVHRVIGAAHSGWKGTVGHIAARVIEVMRDTFGTQPADVDVWLGPSIRRCCYEVSDMVADPVRSVFGSRVLVKRFHRPDKFLLSLQACIQQDLAALGVRREHIHDTGICTACQSDVLFSHRADGGKTGRMMGAVTLSPQQEPAGI